MNEYLYCPVCGAKLEEKIIEKRKRKYCSYCDFVDYKNPLPSAGAIAVRNNKILLIKRGEEPAKGIWAPPSGFIESGETSEDACLRELKEETGVTGEIVDLLGVYHHSSELYGDILVIMYLVNKLKGEIIAGDDADDVAFFAPGEVNDLFFDCYNKPFNKALKMLESDGNFQD